MTPLLTTAVESAFIWNVRLIQALDLPFSACGLQRKT